LFHNVGGRFEDVSRAAGPAFQQPLVARALAFADYDEDGDVDLAVSCSGGPVRLWRNDSRRGHWLQVRLRGRRPDTEALNAQVIVTCGGRSQIGEVHSGRGYLADSERRLTFGLGNSARVDRLVVHWPDGATLTRRDLPADQRVTLSQPSRKGAGEAGADG
jgi:hypothetical protein